MRQNLALHARLFEVPEGEIAGRVEEMATRFGLREAVRDRHVVLPLPQPVRLMGLTLSAIAGDPDDEPSAPVRPAAQLTLF